MKLLTRHTSLIIIFGFPITAILLALTWIFPQGLNKFFYFHWLILAIALIFALSPLGKIRLQPKLNPENVNQPINSRLSFTKWLSQIIAMQFALQVLFIEILHFTNNILPIFAYNHKISSLSASIIYLGFFEGLFPWALYALHTVNLGLQAYCLQKDAFFHTSLNFLWPRTANQPLAALVNTLSRALSMGAMSSTLVLLSVWVVYLSGYRFIPLTFGFNLSTFMVILSLFLFFLYKKIRIGISQKFLINKPFGISLLIVLIIFSALLFATNSLFHLWQNTPIKPPGFLINVQHKGSDVFYLLFMNSWWLVWLPLMSVFFGYLSSGYRIRHIIYAILVWPLISVFILVIWPTPVMFLSSLPNSINLLIALAAGSFIIFLLSSKKFLPMLILCYLPSSSSPKQRKLTAYFQQLLIYMAVLLYLYLPAGLIGLTPYFIIPSFPIAALACIGIISCIRAGFFVLSIELT